YIAWASDDLGGSTPNAIRLVASSDGGQSFTTVQTINDEQHGDGSFFQPTAPGVFPAFVSGNSGVQRNVLPRLAISQGTLDGRVQPGQVTIVWDDFGTGPAFPGTYPPDPNTGNFVDLIRSDKIVGADSQTFTTSGTIHTNNPNPNVPAPNSGTVT